jgi:hypothetical protein
MKLSPVTHVKLARNWVGHLSAESRHSPQLITPYKRITQTTRIP